MKYLNFLVLLAVICFAHAAHADGDYGKVQTHLPEGQERAPSVYNTGEIVYEPPPDVE